MEAATTETKTVFLVHGWNHDVRDEFQWLLERAHFKVKTWDQGMRSGAHDRPRTNWENLRASIDEADKVVVLVTPDEESRATRPPPSGYEVERPRVPRPRPNVLYELGMAHALKAGDTVMVTFACEVPSDLHGLHVVAWRTLADTGLDTSARMQLLELLTGDDMKAEPFNKLPMSASDLLVEDCARDEADDPQQAVITSTQPSEVHQGDESAGDRPTSTPTMRFPWSDPIDAIVVDGKLRLIVPDGRAVRSVDPVSGEVVSRCEIGAPIDEVEITHDGLFVCARAGNRVFVAGLDVRGRLIPAWKPLGLPGRRDWQLLTAEGRGPSAVRLVVADGSQTLVKEVRPDTSHDIEFPTDALRAAAVGPSGFLTLPGGDAPPAQRAPWQLVDSASKGKVALTVWAAGPHVLLERRSSRGAMTRDLRLPGDARQVAVARQRKGEPELVLAHVGDELLVWRWGDLEADTS